MRRRPVWREPHDERRDTNVDDRIGGSQSVITSSPGGAACSNDDAADSSADF